MADRTPLPPIRDCVNIYQPAVIDALLVESKRSKSKQSTQTSLAETTLQNVDSASKILTHRKIDSETSRAHAQRGEREKEKQRNEEDFKKATERKHAEQLKQRDENFRRVYKSVVKGLEYDDGITGEMQDLLNQTEKVRSKKKRQLHHDWDKQVFSKIQDRLKRALSHRTYKEIEARLRCQHDAYIKTTNEKLAVFRDVIIEEDYDPLSVLQQNKIKIRTDDIDDPCLQATIKTLKEQQEMGNCDPYQTSTAPGRNTFNTLMWDKVESTPYGHCMDQNGNYMWKPASEAERANRRSALHLDHYNVPKGKDIMLTECAKGRAQGLRLTNKNPDSGGDVFNILQQVSSSSFIPKLPTGCRRKVPGPDAFQDRRGLYEILQQTCKMVQSSQGAKVGDIWLDSKGKQSLPGAEDRLGRRDLFEPLHRGIASSGTSPSGDMWIDRLGKRSLECMGDHNMWEILKTPAPADPPGDIWVGQQYMSNIEHNEIGLTGSAH